jgi:hypothetical protein
MSEDFTKSKPSKLKEEILSDEEMRVLVDWMTTPSYKVFLSYLKKVHVKRAFDMSRSMNLAVNSESIIREALVGKGRIMEIEHLLSLPKRLEKLLADKKTEPGSI